MLPCSYKCITLLVTLRVGICKIGPNVLSTVLGSFQPKYFSWFGKNIDENGKVILSVRNGILVGKVIVNDETYTITPENGDYSVAKEDPSKAIKFTDDCMVKP